MFITKYKLNQPPSQKTQRTTAQTYLTNTLTHRSPRTRAEHKAFQATPQPDKTPQTKPRVYLGKHTGSNTTPEPTTPKQYTKNTTPESKIIANGLTSEALSKLTKTDQLVKPTSEDLDGMSSVLTDRTDITASTDIVDNHDDISDLKIKILGNEAILVGNDTFNDPKSGAGGNVFKYDKYAIKIFKKPEEGDINGVDIDRIEKENAIMLTFDNELFIGKSYGLLEIDSSICNDTYFNKALIVDYYPGTISDLKISSDNQAKFYVLECLEAIRIMHYNGIVHRDIKPDNICISDDGHIKVIDFGVAISLSEKDPQNRAARRGSHIPPHFDTEFMMQRTRGDTFDGSDRVPKQNVTDEELLSYDMFALFSIVYLLTQGKEAKYDYRQEGTQGFQRFRSAISYKTAWTKVREELTKDIQDPQIKELILGLTEYSEQDRWTYDQVKERAWIKSYSGKKDPPFKYINDQWVVQWS